jgi:hypothetical protein
MAEPLNATFFAFRKRERGGVLLGASIAYAVLAFGIFGLFAWLNWQAFIDYIAWTVSMSQASSDPNDPSAAIAAMTPPASVMTILPWYTLLYIVFYVLFAAYEAACLRWMIRGEVKGLFGLALDADTWRVYFTYWLWLFLLGAVYVGIVIVGAVVAVGGVLGMQAGGADLNVGMLFLPIIVLTAVVSIFSYVVVRIAPAAATSIAKRRFAFFDAWTVTKGRFWALFGSFLLLWLMLMVGAFVLTIGLGVAVGLGMMGQIDPTAGPANQQDMLAMFASPSMWAPIAVLYVLMIVGSFVVYVSMFGVNARAALAALEEGKIQAAQ